MPKCPYCINTGIRHTRDLTEEQWKTLDPIIPKLFLALLDWADSRDPQKDMPSTTFTEAASLGDQERRTSRD